MTPDISYARAAAEQALERRERLLIRGPVGSGLRTLAIELTRKREDTVLVELLDLEEPDAPAAGLLEAIAAVPDPQMRQQLIAKLPKTRGTAGEVAKALADAKKSLVVLVPPAWASAGEDTADEDARRARGRDLFRGLTTARSFVLLSDLRVDLTTFGVPSLPEEVLPVHQVSLDPDTPAWGSYSGATRKLRSSLPADLVNSPLVWRLAVGALALGAPLGIVQSYCLRPAADALTLLTPLLADRIRATPALLGPVRRALRLRRPLPADVLATLTSIPTEHLPLLTDCLGYDDPVRISPALRTQLSSFLSAQKASLAETHAALAQHYKLLDGVSSPTLVKGVEQMEAWVERAHHLACAGSLGAQEWNALDLPSPEFYWDRARTLSIRYKRYWDAAQVYLSCLERFPCDDYSHHYAAWNLEQEGREPGLSRQHYAAAVNEAPSNPWWNARFVSFLIRSGDRTAARSAWRQALQAVDPDGTATARDPWLASNLHYWVARTWLEIGCWWEASRVLRGVPQHIREHSRRPFRELEGSIEESARRESSRLVEWLSAQPGPAWVSVQVLWEYLRERIQGLPVPVAGPGEDEHPQLAWSLPELYVEFELDEQGALNWYARDRRTGASEAGASKASEVPPALENWLERVAHA